MQDEIDEMDAIIRQVTAETGMAVIVVEHRLELLRAVAETVLVMDAGKVIAEGPPARRLRRPARPSGVLRGPEGRMTIRPSRSASSRPATGRYACCTTSTSSIAPGERVGLVGLNGHGKTTLLRSVMGLVDWRRGEIELDGKSIMRYADAQARPGGGRDDPAGRRALPGPVGQGQPRLGGVRGRLAGAEASGATGCSGSSPASPTVSARAPARSPAGSGGCARSGEV